MKSKIYKISNIIKRNMHMSRKFFVENRKIRQFRTKFKTLDENKNWAIYMDPCPNDLALLSFTGVGHATGGVNIQHPEFLHSGVDCSRIFIIDKKRSWGNTIDETKIKNVVINELGQKIYVTIGNSMGAFLALYYSYIFGAEVCIAFSPQWSVDPNVMPNENRWQIYTKNIKYHKIRDLSQSFSPICSYYIVVGMHELDEMHIKNFPTNMKNVKIFHLNVRGHDVAAKMKDAGCLNKFVRSCITGEASPSTVLTQSGFSFGPLSANIS